MSLAFSHNAIFYISRLYLANYILSAQQSLQRIIEIVLSLDCLYDLSHLLKVTNRKSRKRSEICSKFTKRQQNDVNEVVRGLLLLTLNIFHTFLQSLYIVNFEQVKTCNMYHQLVSYSSTIVTRKFLSVSCDYAHSQKCQVDRSISPSTNLL